MASSTGLLETLAAWHLIWPTDANTHQTRARARDPPAEETRGTLLVAPMVTVKKGRIVFLVMR
eukprot:11660049-Alexandrium_andersonii.AAC.1